VNIILDGRPIRASRDSARWCIGAIEQLWRMRESKIDLSERQSARQAFDAAIAIYDQIAMDAAASTVGR